MMPTPSKCPLNTLNRVLILYLYRWSFSLIVLLHLYLYLPFIIPSLLNSSHPQCLHFIINLSQSFVSIPHIVVHFFVLSYIQAGQPDFKDYLNISGTYFLVDNNTSRAIGAAVWEPPPPCSTNTATTTLGS